MKVLNRMELSLYLMILIVFIVAGLTVAKTSYDKGKEQAYDSLFNEECSLDRPSMTIICDSYIYEGNE